MSNTSSKEEIPTTPCPHCGGQDFKVYGVSPKVNFFAFEPSFLGFEIGQTKAKLGKARICTKCNAVVLFAEFVDQQ